MISAQAFGETQLGAEFRVNAYTSGTQNKAKIAVRSDGSFVVVWNSQNQAFPGFDIFGQRYGSNGSPAGGEFMVNTYSSSDQRYPAVAMDGAGRFVVVWQSNIVGPNNGVFGQRYNSDGSPSGAQFQVSANITNFQQGYPAVAADTAGSFVVVWNDGSGGPQIVAQRFNSDGTPNGGQIAISSPGSVFRPSVAPLGAGTFVVTWDGTGFAGDSDSYGVRARRFNSGGTADTAEFLVNTFTTGRQSRPAVGADGIGDFVIVWQSGDNYIAKIQGQRYGSAGAPLGGEFKISTLDTFSQKLPAVGVSSSDGRFLVTWGGGGFPSDPGFDNVLARSFSSSGSALGSEFMVNTYTSFGQYNPSVGVDAAGNFVVVWGDLAQDTSSTGVFGQRYGQILPVELAKFTAE